MTIVRLDGELPFRRQVVALSNRAFGLYIASICWCAPQVPRDSDAVVSADELKAVARTLRTRPARSLAELVEARLVVPVLAGWQIPRKDELGQWLWSIEPPTRSGHITGWLRQKIYERDGRRCLECGAEDDLTLDHIHPRSLGGPDTEENLRTLCRSCNSSKGARV